MVVDWIRELNMFGYYEDNTWNICAEIDDQCYKCPDAVICPLLEAVKMDMVGINYDSIQIKNCGIYKKYHKSHLKIV